jgi:hypothetical protein
MKNLVLYVVSVEGARIPALSCGENDPFAAVKFGQKLGEVLRVSEQRGVPAPDFVAVSESRVADESGRVVVSAEFVELDVLSLAPKSAKFGTLNELFQAKAKGVAAVEVDPAVAKSAALSV